jgi:hypothetical protein
LRPVDALVMFRSAIRCKALADKDDKRSEREQRNSGQVQHDDRGNAVWQWAADTARTAMASTSQVLRKLDLTGLSLESDQPTETSQAEPGARNPGQPERASQRSTSDNKKRGVDSRKGGFDPYSTNAGTAKRAPAAAPANKRAAGAQPAPPSAANVTRRAAESPPRRASWWQRLLGRG